MDIPTLTEAYDTSGHAVGGMQYAVLDPDGSYHAYGDQSWVAYGKCIEDGSHPNGKIRRRSVLVLYGEWEDAS